MGRRDEGKEQFWRAAVAEHWQSGLSVREFCKGRQLVENSFYAWRREILKRDAAAIPADGGTAAASDGRGLVPVEVVPAGTKFSGRAGASASQPALARLELVSPEGWVLRFEAETRPATIAALVDVLGAQRARGEPC